MERIHSGRPSLIAAAIFSLTAAAIVTASFLPHVRLWGFATWAHFPDWLILGGGGAALLLGGGALVLRRRKDTSAQTGTRFTLNFPLASALFIAAAGMLFYLFRTKCHFLGDGYSALSLLSDDLPLVKNREVGESLSHVLVKNLHGGEGAAAAMFSFRFLSILSGLAFIGAVLLSAAKLFSEAKQRWLFTLGMTSGGYMLLYFGYVENYSLFVTSSAVYILAGVLAARDKVPRWWILPPLAAAVFFHILGVTLIPSAAYLLASSIDLPRRHLRIPRLSIMVLTALAVVIGAGAAGWFYRNDLFFRYSLVPLSTTPFATPGYTLFSGMHLIDLVNLMFILAPCTGLVVWAIGRAVRLRQSARRWSIFLLIVTVCTMGAAAVFDPKLGMPRDWDLFAFTAIAPVAWFFMTVLKEEEFGLRGRQIALFAVVLGTMSLAGRVAASNVDRVLIERFNDYLMLDPNRDRNARHQLVKYYQASGDSAAVEAVCREWKIAFPVRDTLQKALDLKHRDDLVGALALLEKIVQVDPGYADAWSNMGEILMRMYRSDSALACFAMAIGLNPYDASSYSDRGLIYMKTNRLREAEWNFQRAREIAPREWAISYNLAATYRAMGDINRAEIEIGRLAKEPTLPIPLHLELFRWYATTGRLSPALAQLRLAITEGADTDLVRSLVHDYPQVEAAVRGR